ncbi:MAG: TetR family transcriptional regulator, partial [Nevskiales bacterium]
ALFVRKELAGISMDDVAGRAGVAKGTLYLYFGSKEALFLALLSRDYESWFDRVDAALAHGAAPLAPRAFARLAVRALEEQRGMLRLIAVLHTLLEHNIDLPTAETFKRMLLSRVTRTGALLEQRLRFLKAGAGALVLAHLHALIIGLQHMAEPAPAIREILKRPEMVWFRVDFYPALANALEIHLIGLHTTAARRNTE